MRENEQREAHCETGKKNVKKECLRSEKEIGR